VSFPDIQQKSLTVELHRVNFCTEKRQLG